MKLFASKKSRLVREQHLTAVQGTIAALDRSQAVIEFQLDGTIITANENFLKTLGYTLADVQGKHHSMFVEPEFARSPDYREFWRTLNGGEF